MWKKILVVFLVLVMALSFAACDTEVGEGVESYSVQEIVGGVIQSLDDIRTYQFDMDMAMDVSGEVDGETIEATVVMESSGVLDLENGQMKIDMAMNMAMAGEDEMEMGMEIYLVGDMMYMMMDVPGMGPMWMKSEMPEGYLGEMSQAEAQVELLKAALEAVQVEVVGSETVGGVDCYVLQLTPDAEQLWQLVMQQTQLMGEIPEVEEGLLQDMFRSFSVKQWIAKDTYFITRAEIGMALEMTSEAMGSPEGEGAITMDISMVLLPYDYNQAVSIVLPPEAEEASEMPMFPMQD